MRRTLKTMALAGVLTIGGTLGLETSPARAQGFGYGGCNQGFSGGYYGRSAGGYGGVGYVGAGYVGGGYVGGGYGGGYGRGFGGGYGGLPPYNPNLPWSPAQQQGWREGRLFWETGIRPNHPMSPAERQGFVAGERREAYGPYRPW